MDIVLYALTALLYGGLAVAGWRAHRNTAVEPALPGIEGVGHEYDRARVARRRVVRAWRLVAHHHLSAELDGVRLRLRALRHVLAGRGHLLDRKLFLPARRFAAARAATCVHGLGDAADFRRRARAAVCRRAHVQVAFPDREYCVRAVRDCRASRHPDADGGKAPAEHARDRHAAYIE